MIFKPKDFQIGKGGRDRRKKGVFITPELEITEEDLLNISMTKGILRKKSCAFKNMENADSFLFPTSPHLVWTEKIEFIPTGRSQVTSWHTVRCLTPHTIPTSTSTVHLPEARRHMLVLIRGGQKMYFKVCFWKGWMHFVQATFPLLPTLNTAWSETIVAILRSWWRPAHLR